MTSEKEKVRSFKTSDWPAYETTQVIRWWKENRTVRDMATYLGLPIRIVEYHVRILQAEGRIDKRIEYRERGKVDRQCSNLFKLYKAKPGTKRCISCGKDFESPDVKQIHRCKRCKSSEICQDDDFSGEVHIGDVAAGNVGL
jgi:predicted Zn-ribbon and HTH transcriptional regulator